MRETYALAFLLGYEGFFALGEKQPAQANADPAEDKNARRSELEKKFMAQCQRF